MLRRLILIFCFLLVACGPAPTPPATEPAEQPTQPAEVTEEPTQPPEATESPTEEQETSWENPYEHIITDLCPEDKTLTEDPAELPVWGVVTPDELDGQPVFVRRGLYANSQQEIFRIDVIGVTVEAVNSYIDAPVKICLDYLTTETFEKADEEPPSSPGPAPAPFGANPEDLIIKIYVQGLFNPEEQADTVKEIIQEIVNTPVKDWEEQFRNAELPYPDSEQDFVIDFVIDPPVDNSATHQYQEQRATRIYAKTSVRDGAGSVISGICRGGLSTTPLRWTVVTVIHGGSPDTIAKSDDPGTGFAYKYDLGVKGNSSGTYRISGRWFWPGWSAEYWHADPAGSSKNCDP